LSDRTDAEPTRWANPYSDLQRLLRIALRDGTRRTNGCITKPAFMDCALPGASDKAEKMALRLFTARADDTLEWKPELVSKEVVLDRLNGSTAFDTQRLLRLWQDSRQLSRRTPFPFLAPAANTSQLVSRDSWSQAPVFGVDLLLRPPTTFSGDREDKELRNALKLGEEKFALVIHGTFDKGRLIDDDEYLARLVFGDAFSIPKIVSLMGPTIRGCEQTMRAPLIAGDARGAVDAALPLLNDFARQAAAAFVN